MSRTSLLILLGILIVLVPFSGLPSAIRTPLLVLFGIGVSAIGFSMRLHEAKQAVSRAVPSAPPPEPVVPHDVSPI